MHYRKPILCNRYTIYRTDIEPCGFRVVLMEGFLTDEVVAEVRRVLDDMAYRDAMVDHNYEVARQYFSFDGARTELAAILEKPALIPRVT